MLNLTRLFNTVAKSKPIIALLKWCALVDQYLVATAGILWRNVLFIWRLLQKYLWPYVQAFLSLLKRMLVRFGKTTSPWLVRLLQFFPWSCYFGVLALIATAVALHVWEEQEIGLARLVGLTTPQATDLLKQEGIAALFRAAIRLAGFVTIITTLGSLLAFVHSKASFWIVKASAASYAVLVVFLFHTLWRVPAVLHAVDWEAFPSNVRNELWVNVAFRLLPIILHTTLFLFLLVLRSVSNFYRKETLTQSGLGDRIWRNLCTHGSDPRFRKSLYRAIAIHIFFIFVLPFMLTWGGGGCMRPYELPRGSGNPVLQMVKVRKLKKKKEEKKYVINLNTPILFYIPKIEESEVFEEVEKVTEDIYEAQTEQIGGKLGVGGGKKGGWPNGMENARVRFIRLEYNGGDWDQDMGYGGDYNMLSMFRQLTGFNIWPETESIHIRQLERFPRKRAPPFAYITGGLKGSMNISQSETKTLRHYCLKMGGMIFADDGGGNFDSCFKALLRRTFPDLPLVGIAYDDVIFRQPFLFPRGAPPLWHHSGNAALGVKYQGRWIVFYHRGDINDAWKDGHSGASEGVAMQAYKMGVNVIAYSFNQYMYINFGGTVPK